MGRVVTVATKEEEVDEIIKALMSNSENKKRLIGLDMIPIRVAPGPSTSGKASSAILQLCDSNSCLIVRLHSSHTVSESLYNFLTLPCFIFAGFGIKDTINSLKKDYGLLCKNTLEVSASSWKQDTRNSIGSTFKSMYIPPTNSISDAWGSNCKLTEDEITLAVANADAAYRLGYEMVEIFF